MSSLFVAQRNPGCGIPLFDPHSWGCFGKSGRDQESWMGLGWDGLKILSFTHSALRASLCARLLQFPSSLPWDTSRAGKSTNSLGWRDCFSQSCRAFSSFISDFTQSPGSTGAECTSKIPEFFPKSQVQDCVHRSHWINRFLWDLNFLFPLLEGSWAC